MTGSISFGFILLSIVVGFETGWLNGLAVFFGFIIPTGAGAAFKSIAVRRHNAATTSLLLLASIAAVSLAVWIAPSGETNLFDFSVNLEVLCPIMGFLCGLILPLEDNAPSPDTNNPSPPSEPPSASPS